MRNSRVPEPTRVALFGLLGCALAACGRVGYDVLPDEQRPSVGGAGGRVSAGDGGSPGTPRDGGTGGESQRDASLTDTSRDASDGRVGPTTDGATRTLDGASSNPVDARGRRDAARDAASTCVPPTVPDYCIEVPPLAAAPDIDGRLDCGLALRQVAPLGWNGKDSGPPEVSAEYAVGYRPDGLYFFVRVHDATRIPPDPPDQSWQGDGVELYVDDDGTFAVPAAYDEPGSRQLQVTAPVDSTTPSTRGELVVPTSSAPREPWTAPRFGAFPTPDGYVVEAFVTSAELGLPTWTLTSGGHIGMDVGINVSYDDPTFIEPSQKHRLGQFFVNVASSGNPGPFANTGAFCLPTLSAP